MDAVPVDFCERVSALWRCCDKGFLDLCCGRPRPSFEAAKWSVGERIKVYFFLVPVDRKWKYGFTNPAYSNQMQEIREAGVPPELDGIKPEEVMLTVCELKKRSDLKRFRLDGLTINGLNGDPSLTKFLKSLDMDVEQLLKVTSCLADEPSLNIDGLAYLKDAPEGAIVKKWIEERWFNTITIDVFSAADQSLLDLQTLWRKPTYFGVASVKDDEDGVILQDYLTSGRIRQLLVDNNLIFKFEVMEAIIENCRLDDDGCYIFTVARRRIAVEYDPERNVFDIDDFGEIPEIPFHVVMCCFPILWILISLGTTGVHQMLMYLLILLAVILILLLKFDYC